MAKYVCFIICLVALIGLQFGFLPGLALLGGVINLIVLILVLSSFLEIEKEGLIIALILAAFYDFYLYSFFGLAIIAVLLIYFILKFLKTKISLEPSYFNISFGVLLATILFDLIVLAGLAVKDNYNFINLLLYHIFPDALINLAICLPLYIMMRKIVSYLRLYRLIGAKEKRILV